MNANALANFVALSSNFEEALKSLSLFELPFFKREGRQPDSITSDWLSIQHEFASVPLCLNSLSDHLRSDAHLLPVDALSSDSSKVYLYAISLRDTNCEYDAVTLTLTLTVNYLEVPDDLLNLQNRSTHCFDPKRPKVLEHHTMYQYHFGATYIQVTI